MAFHWLGDRKAARRSRGRSRLPRTCGAARHYLLKLAEQKTMEAELMTKQDDDSTYLLRLAEQKTNEAEAKAREDKEATGPMLKPNMPHRSMRGENAELWALMNYSKKGLETGSTP